MADIGRRLRPVIPGVHPLRVQLRCPGEHLAALLGFSILTAVFMRPLPLTITERVVGSRDVWQHLWNLWWMKTALLELHTNPYYTQYLYFPAGVPLHYHTLTPVNGLLSIPFQLLGRLVYAYNALVSLGYVLGGYGSYVLARRYVGPGPAFIAGLIFGFCPHHTVQTAVGHLDHITHFWLPFYVLAFLIVIEEQRWRIGVVAAILLALASLVTWYYAFALITFSIVAVVHQLWQSWTQDESLKPTLSIAVFIGAVYGLLVAPVLIPTLLEGRRATYMVPPLRSAAEFSADLLAFATPSVLHPWWGERMMSIQGHFTGKMADNVVFVGFVPLVLAGVAMVTRRRAVGRWILVAAVFFVLALGPWLHVNGSIVRVFGRAVALPYALLYRWVPFVKVIRTPSRMSQMLMLAVGILAALGLDGVLAYLHRQGRGWQLQAGVSVLTGALILFEFWPKPLPTAVPPSAPAFVRNVLEEGGAGAVLDVPQTNPHGAMYYQTLHHRPIAGGYLSREPENPLESVAPLRQLAYLSSGDEADVVQTSASPAEAAAVLGFRYVILHKAWLSPDQGANSPARIEALLGKLSPSYRDDDVIVYTLVEPADPKAVAYLVDRDGWYGTEISGNIVFRWMTSPAAIRVAASAPMKVRLVLTPHAAIQRSTLEIHTGEGLVGTYSVVPGETITTPPFSLQSGDNLVRLVVPEGNVIPAETYPDSSDFRRLAIAIRQMQVIVIPADRSVGSRVPSLQPWKRAYE